MINIAKVLVEISLFVKKNNLNINLINFATHET